MRIKRLIVNNICQHSYRELDFELGLNGLVGPNGCGKSNLLAAIYFAFTGETDRFRHPKREKVINQHCQLDDKVGVELYFSHRNVDAYLKRFIRPNERELKIDNLGTYTADKDIGKALEDWLGMSLKTLGQYVFVSQTEMYSILSSSTTARAEELYRLFNLSKAEQCYDIVGSRISSLVSPTCNIDIDSVRARILSNRSRAREIDKKISVLDLKLDPHYCHDTDPNKFIIDSYNQYVSITDELTKMTLERVSVSDTVSKSRKRLLEIESQFADNLNDEAKQLKLSIEKAKEAQTQWLLYEKFKDTKSNLESQIQILQSEIDRSDSMKPVKPDNYIEEHDSKFYDVYNKTSDEMLSIETQLTNLGDGSCCPTCGFASNLFFDKKEQLKQKLDELHKLGNAMDKQIYDSQQHRRVISKYNQYRRVRVEKIVYHQEHLKTLKEIQEPTSSYKELETQISENQSRLQQINQLRQEYTSITQTLSRTGGQLDLLSTQIQKKREYLKSITTTKEQYEAAVVSLKQNQIWNQERINLNLELTQLKRLINDDEVSLESVLETQNKQEAINSFKSELTSIRSVLHRNALPLDIAQSHLQQLRDSMNTLLTEWTIDFRIKTEEGLKFIVEFNDGRVLPAEALSGGEMIIFALAWRLAVHFRFASDIGLLCLDEPTVWLDKGRLECLKLAIEKMRSMANTSGLQCLLITHELELLNSMDKVIDLSKGTI